MSPIELKRRTAVRANANTLAQRFGFSDPDLATPAHDALLMWLSENLEVVAAEKLGELEPLVEYLIGYNHFRDTPLKDFRKILSEEDRSADEVEELVSAAYTAFQTIPEEQTTFDIEQVWECPIMNGSYTVGFCDMKARVTQTRKNARLVLATYELKVDKFVDSYETREWYFEIKPSIPSLGELLRQLNMYKSYTEYGSWLVVSPDERWRKQIESQGFGFVKAPQ